MKENNIETYREYEEWYTNYSLAPIQDFLKQVESRGIPTIVFTWPNENLHWIKQNPWMKERVMQIKYNDTFYNSMNDLMGGNGQVNPELTLRNDYEYFEVPPDDDHPSKLCHEIMAQNVIQEIERRGLL